MVPFLPDQFSLQFFPYRFIDRTECGSTSGTGRTCYPWMVESDIAKFEIARICGNVL